MRGNYLWGCTLILLPLLAGAAQLESPLSDAEIVQKLAEGGFNRSLFKGYSNYNASGCALACQALESVFPANVIARNETAYNAWQSRFWSTIQAEVDPYCIFQPTNNKAVSSVVLLSRITKCPFAVKSGGHAAFAGASNIEGGITIDFANFKEVSVSKDKKLVGIGPGNIWHDVYTALQSRNLTVIGGRVYDVGVGGLTLGGGISFFSSMHGWACDNVFSYELVDANGNILNVRKDTYPDLYWALRGGGNNFGIVTKFTVFAYPLGIMWGGPVIYLPTEVSSLATAFENFPPASVNDPKAALILVLGYSQGSWVNVAYMEYAEPVAAGTHPKIFDELVAIPSVADQTGNKSLADITVEMQGGPAFNGHRQTFWTATFKLDKQLITRFYQLFMQLTNPILGVDGLVPVCSFQPITKGILDNMNKNGGNALGLGDEESPLMTINYSYMWNNEADDEAVFAVAKTFYKELVEQSKSLGLYHEYIYINYASQYQDVFSGYGKENHARLKKISKKYDPAQVFQKLQPGYFKL